MLLSLSYPAALASEHAASIERGKGIAGAMALGLVVSLILIGLASRRWR